MQEAVRIACRHVHPTHERNLLRIGRQVAHISSRKLHEMVVCEACHMQWTGMHSHKASRELGKDVCRNHCHAWMILILCLNCQSGRNVNFDQPLQDNTTAEDQQAEKLVNIHMHI